MLQLIQINVTVLVKKAVCIQAVVPSRHLLRSLFSVPSMEALREERELG